MTGFELQISGVGSDRSTNCASTNASSLMFVMLLMPGLQRVFVVHLGTNYLSVCSMSNLIITSVSVDHKTEEKAERSANCNWVIKCGYGYPVKVINRTTDLHYFD